MADRPILFSAPMVRALLDGRKTQTRRILKPQPEEHSGMNCRRLRFFNRNGFQIGDASPDEGGGASLYAPYAPGDQLWVKEAIEKANGEAIGYRATGDWLPNTPWQWKPNSLPSMYMPRRLSRLTLTVTDVRVQRLQDISEEDAIAEGIERIACSCSDGVTRNLWHGIPHVGNEGPVQAYADLWDSINNPRGYCADDCPNGWVGNPWIVAVSFDVRKGNIDA